MFHIIGYLHYKYCTWLNCILFQLHNFFVQIDMNTSIHIDIFMEGRGFALFQVIWNTADCVFMCLFVNNIWLIECLNMRLQTVTSLFEKTQWPEIIHNLPRKGAESEGPFSRKSSFHAHLFTEVRWTHLGIPAEA